jgi:hypothetical protein
MGIAKAKIGAISAARLDLSGKIELARKEMMSK